jgi:ATP phosphoribosyltransferase regulatory subunit
VKRRRASLPTGAAAYVFEEATRRRGAEDRIVAGLRSAGYQEAIVPSADYLTPYLPHLSVRADFTIALARHLAPRLAADGSADRVFYRGEVLRGASRDGSSAEFYQVGAELLGDPSPDADAEIVERCLEALKAASRGPVYVVLSAVGAIEEMLGPEMTGGRARDFAAAIRERRLSETAGTARGVSSEFAARVRRLLEGDLPAYEPLLRQLGPVGATLSRVAGGLSGRTDCQVAIDVAEPASRSYYTGFFFSVYGESGGEPVAGGGRYDALYAAFGNPRPAVGFALGLEGAVGA